MKPSAPAARVTGHNNGGDMATRRILPWVLTLGLLFLATGFTNGAGADICGDDCAPEPLSSYFTELADATLAYYPPNPATEQLVRRVLLAQDALYPPNPATPPAPIRSFALLNSFSYEVEALAGTANGATGADAAFLLGEAYELQGLIAAAYPSLQFPPSAFHPPNPA